MLCAAGINGRKHKEACTMSRNMEELLGKGETLKESLEKELEIMGQTETAENSKKELQVIRTNTLEHLEAAIVGITALIAWKEDLVEQ